MEQKFDGPLPRAEIRLDGRRVTRSDVTNDWGMQLRWVVRRDGKPVATAPARADTTFESLETTPGAYEVVLEMWKYEGYAKGADGEFTKSKFVPISNTVQYKI